MTLYDSSVLIDYLAGDELATEYVEAHLDERAITVPLVMFEIYQGEVFKSGTSDFDAVDGALEWLDVVEERRVIARSAAELQDAFVERGTPLTARDAFIAGAAAELDERLAVADADFDVPGLTDELAVDFVREK